MFSTMRSKQALASLYRMAPVSLCSVIISLRRTVAVAVDSTVRPGRPPACSGDILSVPYMQSCLVGRQ